MTTLFTALCLLLLGLAFFYFVRYLCAHGPICIPWTHVSSVDEDGKQVGRGRWVRTPRPDRIDRNGLNHIVKYVARLVKSQSDNAHLIISSTDGNKASLVCRDKGHLKIIEMVYTGSSTPTKRKEPFSSPHIHRMWKKSRLFAICLRNSGLPQRRTSSTNTTVMSMLCATFTIRSGTTSLRRL
jgi:hypothetical protein